MRDRRCRGVLLLAALLATGCTATIGGQARPAPGASPGSLPGSTVEHVLLDGAALSRLLHQPFQTVPAFPPVFGGSEKLGDAYQSASPAECVGVVYATQKSAYESADVKNIAAESWQHDGQSVKVDDVYEAVVSLATAADAEALFARFSAQWKDCDGKTLTLPSGPFVRDAITDVRTADSVVAATVSLGPAADSILASVPEARAVGVRANCLVEVNVAFFGNSYPSDRGSGDVETSAADIARAMLQRVGA